MTNEVIWIIVAIGIALMAFLIASGMLGTSKIKLTDMLSWVGWQKEELSDVKTIEAACNAWLNGGDKYNAKAILDNYAITEKSVPFTTLTCCSADLKTAAEDNIKACSTDSGSAECNGGNIPFATIQGCWSACQKVLGLEDSCRGTCSGANEAQITNCIAVGVEASTEICSGVVATASAVCG